VGFSDELRAACAPIWDGLHAHPFLREIAEGTLPLEKFRFFLEQDNFYLEDYARCLALGAARSQNLAALRSFSHDLIALVDAELPSNRALLAQVVELGAADHGGNRRPAPATLAYTSYLLSVASRGDVLDVMASVLPCSWSYVEIAGRLREEVRAPSGSVYRGWIDFFALPANAEVVAAIRGSFDELAADANAQRRRSLTTIFATSSRLEADFWEMAYTMAQAPSLA